MKTKKGAICLPNILRFLLLRKLCHCKNINTLLQYGSQSNHTRTTDLSNSACWLEDMEKDEVRTAGAYLLSCPFTSTNNDSWNTSDAFPHILAYKHRNKILPQEDDPGTKTTLMNIIEQFIRSAALGGKKSQNIPFLFPPQSYYSCDASK